MIRLFSKMDAKMTGYMVWKTLNHHTLNNHITYVQYWCNDECLDFSPGHTHNINIVSLHCGFVYAYLIFPLLETCLPHTLVLVNDSHEGSRDSLLWIMVSPWTHHGSPRDSQWGIYWKKRPSKNATHLKEITLVVPHFSNNRTKVSKVFMIMRSQDTHLLGHFQTHMCQPVPSHRNTWAIPHPSIIAWEQKEWYSYVIF